MKHKMIGCSEECLRLACCDFCAYAHHGFFFADNGSIVSSGPIGCGLHRDQEHQEIAQSCSYCSDFCCFNANKDNRVVKEIDDDEMA